MTNEACPERAVPQRIEAIYLAIVGVSFLVIGRCLAGLVIYWLTGGPEPVALYCGGIAAGLIQCYLILLLHYLAAGPEGGSGWGMPLQGCAGFLAALAAIVVGLHGKPHFAALSPAALLVGSLAVFAALIPLNRFPARRGE